MNDKLRMSTSYEPEVDAMDSNFNENEIKFEYKKKVKSCLVCGDNAFYYFYGAITCDSCRTFFRRQILQFKVNFNIFIFDMYIAMIENFIKEIKTKEQKKACTFYRKNKLIRFAKLIFFY